MRSAAQFALALTTVGSEANALALARVLVGRRLAACVNVIPKVRSVYRWKGKREEAREWLLVMKTRRKNLTRMEKVIRELHSYEVPEILSIALDQGSSAYLKWLGAEI